MKVVVGRAGCAALLIAAMWMVSAISQSGVPDAATLAFIFGIAMGVPIVLLNALMWSLEAA
jgi:hypothetical protein